MKDNTEWSVSVKRGKKWKKVTGLKGSFSKDDKDTLVRPKSKCLNTNQCYRIQLKEDSDDENQGMEDGYLKVLFDDQEAKKDNWFTGQKTEIFVGKKCQTTFKPTSLPSSNPSSLPSSTPTRSCNGKKKYLYIEIKTDKNVKKDNTKWSVSVKKGKRWKAVIGLKGRLNNDKETLVRPESKCLWTNPCYRIQLKEDMNEGNQGMEDGYLKVLFDDQEVKEENWITGQTTAVFVGGKCEKQ